MTSSEFDGLADDVQIRLIANNRNRLNARRPQRTGNPRFTGESEIREQFGYGTSLGTIKKIDPKTGKEVSVKVIYGSKGPDDYTIAAEWGTIGGEEGFILRLPESERVATGRTGRQPQAKSTKKTTTPEPKSSTKQTEKGNKVSAGQVQGWDGNAHEKHMSRMSDSERDSYVMSLADYARKATNEDDKADRLLTLRSAVKAKERLEKAAKTPPSTSTPTGRQSRPEVEVDTNYPELAKIAERMARAETRGQRQKIMEEWKQATSGVDKEELRNDPAIAFWNDVLVRSGGVFDSRDPSGTNPIPAGRIREAIRNAGKERGAKVNRPQQTRSSTGSTSRPAPKAKQELPPTNRPEASRIAERLVDNFLKRTKAKSSEEMEDLNRQANDILEQWKEYRKNDPIKPGDDARIDYFQQRLVELNPKIASRERKLAREEAKQKASRENIIGNNLNIRNAERK